MERTGTKSESGKSYESDVQDPRCTFVHSRVVGQCRDPSAIFRLRRWSRKPKRSGFDRVEQYPGNAELRRLSPIRGFPEPYRRLKRDWLTWRRPGRNVT